MPANSKNKILITRNLPNALFIGIISQKLPHEIIYLLTDVICVNFEKKTSTQIEAFVATKENKRFILISNNLYKEFHVDYFLIIVSTDTINIDYTFIDEFKKNTSVLGVYVLNMPKKKNEQLLSMLKSLF